MAFPGDDQPYDIDSILDEMREEYWQGLAQEEPEAKEILECLVFVLGGERFAFATQFASAVVRVPKLVPVPEVQEIIVGIFNLRGEITAAMDIRPMLGLPQPELTPSGRIVVVKSKSFATGLLVEAALGIQELSFDGYEPDPDDGRRFVRGAFREEAASIWLLDLEALLASPEILAGEP